MPERLYAEERSTVVPEPPVAGGFTNKLRLMVVDCAGTPAEVPVMVAPRTAVGLFAPVSGNVLLTLSVRVLVLVGVAVAGLSDHVTPLGGVPDKARSTVPLKPLNDSTAIVSVTVPPWLTDTPATGTVPSEVEASPGVSDGTSSNQGSATVT